MVIYDKKEIKESLSIENIFELLQEFGGEPEYTSFGILSSTICHNPPGMGSRKLYYYSNSELLCCYSGCADFTFDIFELTSKVAEIQWNKKFDLNDAVRWVANFFGLAGISESSPIEKQSEDWKYLGALEKIQDIEIKTNEIILKEYDPTILERFNYNVLIEPWLREGVSQESMRQAQIGFYPGGDQITIPHFDENGRLVGLRGRTLCAEEGERFGKYRPLKVNQQLYNHPLGMNLYNLNNSKDKIGVMKKAIVFEGKR